MESSSCKYKVEGEVMD